ncbi:MAG TPA: hypothetical protein VFX59_22540 [Polyangiales bacterium]|nr:hypothetical protein [Polyangiales bacterium]
MNVAAETLEHLEQDDDFAVATFDRYLLLVWRRRITAPGASAAQRALTRLYAQRPLATLGFITLVEDACSLSVAADVRDTIARMLKDHNYALGAAAVAYERAGFVSAIVRSVITAINVASRAVFPSQVNDRLEDAIAFTTSALSDGSPERQRALLAALNQMRSREASPARRRLTERLQAFVRRDRSA